MQKPQRKISQAFTLIEILIALFIFAIVGTIAALALNNAIKIHRQVINVDNRLQNLTIAMTLLQLDTRQVIDRNIIDSTGKILPAFISIGNNGFTFTRTGLINPMQIEKRSQLQRVAYVWQRGDLIRLTWDVVDQAPNTQYLQQVLLQNVSAFRLQYLNSAGKVVNTWLGDLDKKSREQEEQLPRAIIITMQVKGWGLINDVLPIVARGFDVPKKKKSEKASSKRAD